MSEVEVKILDINRQDVEARLRGFGARKTFDDEMYAVYLDDSGDSLKKRCDLLRLRMEGDRCVLTFKEFISNQPTKIHEEIETGISDFESMRSIFEKLGFKEWLVVRKHRTSYDLEGVHFEFDKYLDHYDYIPEFLEVEGKDSESIFRHIEDLGLSIKDCRPWSFLDVAAYYAGKDE